MVAIPQQWNPDYAEYNCNYSELIDVKPLRIAMPVDNHHHDINDNDNEELSS